MELVGKYELLSDIVYNTIKEAIISGDMKPETKISETRLARELGVSRTPVREALRILSVEGFVRLSPNSSFIVSAFSLEDAVEILEVRKILEGEAAYLAAKNITQEKTKVLKAQLELITDLEKDKPENTAERFTQTDIDFHKEIYKICGNSRLESLGGMLQDKQSRLYLAKGDNFANNTKTFLTQHREILEAVMKGNETEAKKRACEHVDLLMSLARQQ